MGRVRIRIWTRGRLLMVLAASIGLPWLSALDGPPVRPAFRQVITGPHPLRSLAFHPRGRTIAAVDVRGKVRLHPRFDGQGPSRELAGVRPALAVEFSPDGRYLAIGLHARDVILCDLDRQDACRALGIPLEEISGLCFSPDGRTLVVSSFRSGKVLLWDLETGTSRIALGEGTSPVIAMAFSPDGRSLTTIHRNHLTNWMENPVRIWDLGTGRSRPGCNALGFIIACAITPDSRMMAISHEDRCEILMIDAGSVTPVRAIPARPSIRSLAFSPDAKLLAASTGEGLVDIYGVATGRRIHRLDGEDEIIARLMFSPDGATLARAGHGGIQFWDLDIPIAGEARP